MCGSSFKPPNFIWKWLQTFSPVNGDLLFVKETSPNPVKLLSLLFFSEAHLVDLHSLIRAHNPFCSGNRGKWCLDLPGGIPLIWATIYDSNPVSKHYPVVRSNKGYPFTEGYKRENTWSFRCPQRVDNFPGPLQSVLWGKVWVLNQALVGCLVIAVPKWNRVLVDRVFAFRSNFVNLPWQGIIINCGMEDVWSITSV